MTQHGYIKLLFFVGLIILITVDVTQCKKNPLYQGSLMSDFFVSCTPAAQTQCLISTPDDFKKLNDIKASVRFQLEFILSPVRFGISVTLLFVIFLLALHLTIVRRFDWRSLPIIRRFYPEVLEEMDRKNRFLYHQYIWMRHRVLQGNHPVFAKKTFNEVNWYRYHDRQATFDYKSVQIEKFTFLDRKNLTKHLIMEIEKERLPDHHLPEAAE